MNCVVGEYWYYSLDRRLQINIPSCKERCLWMLTVKIEPMIIMGSRVSSRPAAAAAAAAGIASCGCLVVRD